MFALQLGLGVYAVVAALLVLFVGVPVLALAAVLSRWGRLGTQLGLLRRRLGMSRSLGWAVGLLVVAGSVVPFAVGAPPTAGSGELELALAGVLYGGGVFVGGWALARRDHLRLIRETPTTDSGGPLQPGAVVELDGEAAVYDSTLTAPVSGADALAYRYRVEEHRWMGRHRAWVPVDHGSDAVAFEVDDGSGPALVAPEGARLDLHDANQVTVAADEQPPEPVRTLTESVDAVDDGDRVRYRERRLDPGDTAYVLGEAVDRPSPDDLSRTVVAEGAAPFVVADRSEESLERRLRWLVVYGGPGGAVAAVAGFGLMLRLAGAL